MKTNSIAEHINSLSFEQIQNLVFSSICVIDKLLDSPSTLESWETDGKQTITYLKNTLRAIYEIARNVDAKNK